MLTEYYDKWINLNFKVGYDLFNRSLIPYFVIGFGFTSLKLDSTLIPNIKNFAVKNTNTGEIDAGFGLLTNLDYLLCNIGFNFNQTNINRHFSYYLNLRCPLFETTYSNFVLTKTNYLMLNLNYGYNIFKIIDNKAGIDDLFNSYYNSLQIEIQYFFM